MERAFKVAIPRAFFRGVPESISSINGNTRRPFNFPEEGMARTCVGQQTASGMDLNGVKQSPPISLLNLTPVKIAPPLPVRL
jgi:hypothetical protein